MLYSNFEILSRVYICGEQNKVALNRLLGAFVGRLIVLFGISGIGSDFRCVFGNRLNAHLTPMSY